MYSFLSLFQFIQLCDLKVLPQHFIIIILSLSYSSENVIIVFVFHLFKLLHDSMVYMYFYFSWTWNNDIMKNWLRINKKTIDAEEKIHLSLNKITRKKPKMNKVFNLIELFKYYFPSEQQLDERCVNKSLLNGKRKEKN